MKFKPNFFAYMLVMVYSCMVLSACKKQEIEFIPQSNTLRTLSYSGYNLSDSTLRIILSEKSINLGNCQSYLNLATGSSKKHIPFTSAQTAFEVLFKTPSGRIMNKLAFPKTGNLDFRFLKLADTVLVNPSFPTPPVGSMLVMLEFHSTLNPSFTADLDMVVYNTTTSGTATTELKVVPAIRRGKLCPIILPSPARTAGKFYAFQLVQTGTRTIFPASAATGTALTTNRKGLISFTANTTVVLSVTDKETITGTSTKRYTYEYPVIDLDYYIN